MELSTLGAWQPLLSQEFSLPYFQSLCRQVDAAYATATVYPPQSQLFSAFSLTPPEAVRAVILGQDPYHEPGQANGLAFSVSGGTPLPPSLRNIFAELSADYGSAPTSGDLSPWARQGVFLLNTVLTVTKGQANSHKNFGWQRFTDAVIAAMAQLPQPIVFLLWGAQAQKKTPLIQASCYPRKLLSAPHPSPLSCYRGFFGSRPFSQANAFLTAHGVPEIQWNFGKE